MISQELMIGDFILHEKYGNAIIETIDNDFGDNPSVKLVSENIKHKDGYKYGYCWCDLNEIFPIPLTPEILEKNGFKEITGKVKKLIWAWKGLDKLIEISEVTPNVYQIVIHKDDSDLGDERVFVRYVHELQHALKLCGFEKNIEL